MKKKTFTLHDITEDLASSADSYNAGLGAPVAPSSQPMQCIPRRMGPKKSVFHTNEKIFL